MTSKIEWVHVWSQNHFLTVLDPEEVDVSSHNPNVLIIVEILIIAQIMNIYHELSAYENFGSLKAIFEAAFQKL